MPSMRLFISSSHIARQTREAGRQVNTNVSISVYVNMERRMGMSKVIISATAALYETGKVGKVGAGGFSSYSPTQPVDLESVRGQPTRPNPGEAQTIANFYSGV